MIHQAQRCLIIPDIHQNIPWVERILAQETGFDLIVFLGDYFDSNLPRKLRTGVAATCSFLEEIKQQHDGKCIFLLGNHDIQYLEAKPACDAHRTPRNLNFKCGSAYRHSAASKIAKNLSYEFWRNSRLFVRVNGFLLSHAGLAPEHWPEGRSVEESLQALETHCQFALINLRSAPSKILQAGVVRGGEIATGGITWLDWDDEFRDSIPFPQIVGHTGNTLGVRQTGRSYCIDGHQTCYGMLTPDGLETRSC